MAALPCTFLFTRSYETSNSIAGLYSIASVANAFNPLLFWKPFFILVFCLTRKRRRPERGTSRFSFFRSCSRRLGRRMSKWFMWQYSFVLVDLNVSLMGECHQPSIALEKMSYICILLCKMYAFHLWIESFSINFMKILFNEEPSTIVWVVWSVSSSKPSKRFLTKRLLYAKCIKLDVQWTEKTHRTFERCSRSIYIFECARSNQNAMNLLKTIYWYSIEDLKSSCTESIECSDEWLQDKWLPFEEIGEQTRSNSETKRLEKKKSNWILFTFIDWVQSAEHRVNEKATFFLWLFIGSNILYFTVNVTFWQIISNHKSLFIKRITSHRHRHKAKYFNGAKMDYKKKNKNMYKETAKKISIAWFRFRCPNEKLCHTYSFYGDDKIRRRKIRRRRKK